MHTPNTNACTLITHTPPHQNNREKEMGLTAWGVGEACASGKMQGTGGALLKGSDAPGLDGGKAHGSAKGGEVRAEVGRGARQQAMRG